MIYSLIKTIILLMSHIPLPVGQFVGKMLGAAFGMLPLNRATVSLENIQKSFSIGIGDAKRLNRRVLSHFGQMLFEVPLIMRLDIRNIDKYVVFVNGENLIGALGKGKGAFILTGHFGNWELMAAATALQYGPGAAVVRPIDFQPLDRLMDELRSRFGTEIIPKKKSMRRVISAIKGNRMVGILLDQNVDWYEGVFVNFFGRWACTNKGLALVALKTGTPVIPVFSVRRRDGRYNIIFENEVQLIETGDKTRDVEENTALFTGIIEKYIKRYPDHWFWFHKRWKTRPYCRLPETRNNT
ncbi:MAG: lysophospholipid acyltransferase family protein [Pseudomonadota bacterium]